MYVISLVQEIHEVLGWYLWSGDFVSYHSIFFQPWIKENLLGNGRKPTVLAPATLGRQIWSLDYLDYFPIFSGIS